MIYRCCSNCKYWQQSGPSPPGVIQQMCTNEQSINKGKFINGGGKCSNWQLKKLVEKVDSYAGITIVTIRD